MRSASKRRLQRVAAEHDATRRWRFLVTGMMLVFTGLRLGLPSGWFHSEAAQGLHWACMALCAGLVWFSSGAESARGVTRILDRALRTEFLLALAGTAIGWWWPGLAAVTALLALAHGWGLYLWLLARGVNPSIVFVGSFVVLIASGTAALKLPAATPETARITWVDALFTSTSAVCVTGLVVRDTGAGFTRLGQSVILVLIQMGALGMILFGAIVALAFGSSISLRAVHAMSDAAPAGATSPRVFRRLLVFTAIVVFGVEAIGAALLYVGWPDRWAGSPAGLDDPGARLFHSVFFAVSAFCNAGFSTNANGLEGLRAHWTSHLVIAGLIALGGLGLPVLANLAQVAWAKATGGRRGRGMVARGGALIRVSLHAKLALVTTALVYLAGFGVIMFSQAVQRGVPWTLAGLDAHFASITTRTAGFNTVPCAEMGPLARLTMMVQMFIGGSPGSAAGGLKTVGFAILLILVWRTILGREDTDAYGRRLSNEMLRKAVALFILHFVIILAVTSTLLVTEQGRFGLIGDAGPFEACLFESISACSTVGLSYGITGQLSDAGRLTLTAGMFLGRVGSLAFLVALVALTRKPLPRYQYPVEGVVLS